MTCAFLDAATPIVSLHAAGVINWNSSRFDDFEITEEMVDQWCADLELARIDCAVPAPRDGRWADLCGEVDAFGEAPAPTVDARRASLERGRAACEDRGALRRRCAERAVATAEDARRLARVRRSEVEAFFEGGLGIYHGIDSDPEAVAMESVRLVDRLGRAPASAPR